MAAPLQHITTPLSSLLFEPVSNIHIRGIVTAISPVVRLSPLASSTLWTSLDWPLLRTIKCSVQDLHDPRITRLCYIYASSMKHGLETMECYHVGKPIEIIGAEVSQRKRDMGCVRPGNAINCRS